jgi:hypothetical protein
MMIFIWFQLWLGPTHWPVYHQPVPRPHPWLNQQERPE